MLVYSSYASALPQSYNFTSCGNLLITLTMKAQGKEQLCVWSVVLDDKEEIARTLACEAYSLACRNHYLADLGLSLLYKTRALHILKNIAYFVP